MQPSSHLYCLAKLSAQGMPPSFPSRIEAAERAGDAHLGRLQERLEKARDTRDNTPIGLMDWGVGAVTGGAAGAGIGAWAPINRWAPVSLAGAAIGSVGGSYLQSKAIKSLRRRNAERAEIDLAAAVRARDDMRAGVVRPDGSYDESALDNFPMSSYTLDERRRKLQIGDVNAINYGHLGGSVLGATGAVVGAAVGAAAKPASHFPRGRAALALGSAGALLGGAVGEAAMVDATRRTNLRERIRPSNPYYGYAADTFADGTTSSPQ
jgi:outer membrane lipoprotein SlyB